MTRSSTSSSSAWRRAIAPGALALVMLLVVDTVLGTGTAARWLASQVERGGRASFVTRLEGRLDDLASTPSDSPRVVVLGNSRAQAAIDPGGLGDVTVTVIARPGIEPFQMRFYADRVARTRPDVVVLAWSEFDTHRPIRLEPVSARAATSVPALLDLLRATDARFAWENRDSLLRSAAAATSNVYRYREVLGQAFGFAWRRFPLAANLTSPAPPPIAGRARAALFDGEVRALPDSTRRRLQRLFPERGIGMIFDQADMVSEIQPGRHVAVQRHLLRRAVEVLCGAGATVVVVETPIHPITRGLYDTGLATPFRAFVAELERDLDVRFVPLGAAERFAAGDFLDLIHLDPSGRARLTARTREAVRRALAE